MAEPEFISLPNGSAQVTLRTGQARGGVIGIVVGGIGLAIAVVISLSDAPWCLWTGCGGFAALVLIFSVWALISALIVAGRLADATLTVSHYPLRLGERFDVTYEQGVRSTHDIESVSITLHCEEIARYQVGTDTRTVKHTALEDKRVLLEGGTATPDAALAATATFEIPATAMHTFDHSNNKIRWTLKLRTDIAKLPDYIAECTLSVVPQLAPHDGGAAAAAPRIVPAAHDAYDESTDEDETDADEDEARR